MGRSRSGAGGRGHHPRSDAGFRLPGRSECHGDQAQRRRKRTRPRSRSAPTREAAGEARPGDGGSAHAKVRVPGSTASRPLPPGGDRGGCAPAPDRLGAEGPLYVQFAQKAVIEWEGKLLLVKKSQDDPHQPGKWELPGGRLLQNESPDEALVREVREEVGLEVDPGRPLAVWSWRLGSEADAPTVVAIVRHCTANDVAVDMSRHDEDDFIDKYAWFDRDSILGLDLIPSAREPLAMALANL
ncbi:NUDIX domain-containing protein [Thermocatellispora tengchongensis]|uniref:NUDIX domain-containing protein n=1 Tax=Thermocatellispora tengchongensis TaxID=1073253 RepID=UPI0036391BF1